MYVILNLLPISKWINFCISHLVSFCFAYLLCWPFGGCAKGSPGYKCSSSISLIELAQRAMLLLLLLSVLLLLLLVYFYFAYYAELSRERAQLLKWDGNSRSWKRARDICRKKTHKKRLQQFSEIFGDLQFVLVIVIAIGAGRGGCWYYLVRFKYSCKLFYLARMWRVLFVFPFGFRFLLLFHTLFLCIWPALRLWQNKTNTHTHSLTHTHMHSNNLLLVYSEFRCIILRR